MRRVLALVFLLAMALAAAAQGARVEPAWMTVELLDVDLPAATPPGKAPRSARERGAEVQMVLPYCERGSWLRITLASLPPEPRLVVNGVSMSRLTLVLPDGRRVERDKTRPSDDAAASSVAAVFELPPEVAPASVLWLHSADRHRNILDVRLLSAVDWRERERGAIAFSLAVYGALAAFVIIGATYWAILRERMFADHALYLVCLLTFMAMSSGLFYAVFPGGFWARLGINAQWGLATAAVAFAAGFATRFIDVAGRAPRIARALDALRVTLLAVAAAAAFSPVPLPYFGAAMALAVVAINLVLVGLGLHASLRRNRYASYFLLGWIPLTACTSLRALQGTGLIEIPYEISFLYALGAVWEALVLTAGIADRALSFRRERDVARHLAERDGLTGVLNRRASEARLAEAIARSRADHVPLAVFFLDLDHFKSINDRFGHAGGDAVLVALARRIATQLRCDDALGRWGGEEFIAIVPGVTPDVARATGERIRHAVEAEPVRVEGQAIPVTVSVGVAMLGGAGEDSAALLQRADAALYRAKDKGRNRVEEALAPA